MSEQEQPAAEDQSEIPCPVCKGEVLEELQEREVTFLGCHVCFGLFVQEENLAEYVARASEKDQVATAFRMLLEKALEGKASPSTRSCPCGKKLMRMGFGESPFVVIDRCPEGHGIWLDKRELKKMIRASRSHAAVEGLIAPMGDDDDDD